MNRNDIRPAVVGVGSGAVVIATAIGAAYVYDQLTAEWGALSKYAAQRRYFTPAERAEIARLKAEADATQARWSADYDRQRDEQHAKFDPQRSTTPNQGIALADLSALALVTEGEHALKQLRRANTIHGSKWSSPETMACDDQWTALQIEFGRRSNHRARRQQPRGDRRLLKSAWWLFHDYYAEDLPLLDDTDQNFATA